jgi:biopolymer transport protein ExbD
MRFRGKNRMHSEINTHSFNDIMFFLMLFFLIVATMSHPSVLKVLLPKAKGEVQVIKQPLEVSIAADTTYYINKTKLSFEQLEPAILDSVKGNEEIVIKLQVDRNITMQKAAEVMDIGARNNIKMSLALQSN